MSVTYCRCQQARTETSDFEIVQCAVVEPPQPRIRPAPVWQNIPLTPDGALARLVEVYVDIEASALAEEIVYVRTGREAWLLRGAYAGRQEFIEAAESRGVDASILADLRTVDPRNMGYPVAPYAVQDREGLHRQRPGRAGVVWCGSGSHGEHRHGMARCGGAGGR